MRFKTSNPVEEMIKSIDTDLKVERIEEEYVWNVDDTTGIFYLLKRSDKRRDNMKKIFEIHHGYGKFDSMELSSMIVEEDTLENREKILEDEFGHWDDFVDKESFLNGKSDSVSCMRGGCDWDEATCGEIVVMTKEQKLFELREAYDIEVEKTVGLFRGVK